MLFILKNYKYPTSFSSKQSLYELFYFDENSIKYLYLDTLNTNSKIEDLAGLFDFMNSILF